MAANEGNGNGVRRLLRSHRRFRNRVAGTEELDSLEVIHAYIANAQYDTPLPAWIKPIEKFDERDRMELGLLEWELDILCREVLLYGSWAGNRSYRFWNELADALNHVKNLQDEIFAAYPEILEKFLQHDLFRIQNQQFPWQRKFSGRTLIRYLKIFGTTEINEMIVDRVGLPIEIILRFGLALYAGFRSKFAMSIPITVDAEFATTEQADTFIRHFSSQYVDLYEAAKISQSLADDFIYTRNPLVVKPLIIHPRSDGKLELLCPIPEYLIRRVTEGLYYEINNTPKFPDLFGPSFQTYVGEVFNVANRENVFTITPEEKYLAKGGHKDTIDWVVSDESAHLFIECKTKRMTYLAKTKILDNDALATDTDKLGKAIAQSYKAINAALSGEHPTWKPDGKPIYPVVVILESLFTVGLTEEINEAVLVHLKRWGIDAAVIERFPYTLASIDDFEIGVLLMAKVGIQAFMSGKTEGEFARWNLHSYSVHRFPDQMKDLDGNLFPDEYERIHKGFSRNKELSEGSGTYSAISA